MPRRRDEPTPNDLPVDQLDALMPSREKRLAVSPDGNMRFGGFEFAPTRLIPLDGETPDFETWDRVGAFLDYAHTGVQFWIGDWINFGEDLFGREDRYAQALQNGRYEYATLRTYAWVARSVPPENRFEKVPFGHYLHIAALPPEQQREWAERVVDQGLSQGELRTQLRLERRTRVAADVPFPTGKFRFFYVDCPWAYDDEGEIVPEPGSAPAFTRAEAHFPTMSIEELVAFFEHIRFQALLPKDAAMGFWIPAPLILQSPGPREVIAAAGFVPKAQFIWDKVDHVYGHYNSVRHEILQICTRGSCTPDAPTPMPDSVVTYKVPGRRRHSGKPEIFRQIMTRLWTRGPYLELFGRAPVEGWTVYGNQIPGQEQADDPVEGDEPVAASGVEATAAKGGPRGRRRGRGVSEAAAAGDAAGAAGGVVAE